MIPLNIAMMALGKITGFAEQLAPLIVFLTADRASCGLENAAELPMQRNLPTFLGLALGLAALTGCVQPAPPPAICPAFTAPLPPAPPPAAILVPPVPVWTPPRRHVAAVAHPVHRVVVHRHWVHRYVARAALSPYCGSVPHPCDVDHRIVPEQ